MSNHHRAIYAALLMLSMVCFLAGEVLASGTGIRYVDTGCSLDYESHGCVDNGNACLCWQEARYEHSGSIPGGQIDLPLTDEVHAECHYIHLWIQSCDTTVIRSGKGVVQVRAQCFIDYLFSGVCDASDCACDCSY